MWKEMKKKDECETDSDEPMNMLRKEFQDQNTKNGHDEIYFQIPETSHHYRKSVRVGIAVKVPVAQVLPLWNIRNILWYIFTAKRGIETFHLIHSEKMKPENFK